MTELRTLSLDCADVAGHAGALEALRADRLDVLIVRGLYDGAAMQRVAERLRAGDPTFDRTRAYAPTRPYARTEVLGLMLSPSELLPRGPELEPYLVHAERFRSACGALFADVGDFEARLTQTLSALGAPCPALLARSDDGRPYSPATIRVLHEGCGAPPHRDHSPLGGCFTQLRVACDLSCQFSYYVPITLPAAGGELRIEHDGEPRQSTHFTPGVGDLIIFVGSRRVHEVLPASGPEARRTIGGFAAFTQAGDALWYWS